MIWSEALIHTVPLDVKTCESRPPATVLVCTRGRAELIPRCLHSIASVLGESDQLLVVEAGSSSARKLVAELGDARCQWLAAGLPGKSRQLNHGIRAARHEVILMTDDDCSVRRGWIDAMAAAFLEPDVGLAFGPVDGLSRLPSSVPGKPLPPGPAPPAMWRFSHGAAMAVRRSAAFEVGGFDERLGPGAAVHGEEADLLLRMQAAGWRCWAADAPAVQHLEWRTEAQNLRNLLVYERGAGAWAGAALRRDPSGAAGAVWTRLRYQADLVSAPPSASFALRAQAAFCAGLWAGMRLAPERFLEPEGDRQMPVSHELAAGAGAAHSSAGRDDAVRRLPWPSVRGRRCLSLASSENALTLELELARRGAAEVLAVELGSHLQRRSATLEQLAAGELGMFDVVVAEDVLGSADDPWHGARTIRSICRSHLLSIERIDLGLSIAARRRPYARRERGERRARWVMNGAAHRKLLDSAGFEVLLASRPWVSRIESHTPPPLTGAHRFRGLAHWALTGDPSAGHLCRALLTRPAPEAEAEAEAARLNG